MPESFSLPHPARAAVRLSVWLFGLCCVTAGMAVVNAADAVERGGAFPWLKVALALGTAGLAVAQGRRLRTVLGAGPSSPDDRGPDASALAG